MKVRQKQSDLYERRFEDFCRKNNIQFTSLDKDNEAQKRFLKNPRGKSPDYLCQKNGENIFVEIKTHTILTNEARNRQMVQTIRAEKAAGLSGAIFFGSFDPIPELKIPFEGYLRDASKKFKNIKDESSFPRILLIDGVQIEEIDILRIFVGSLWNVDRNCYVKKETGLLDKTGSNVSAIAYWVNDLNIYKGVANPKAKVVLTESGFKKIFESSR